jgi:hypothetical protein
LGRPSGKPSYQPSQRPTGQPSMQPSLQPTVQPSSQPTSPTGQPSGQPVGRPSAQPSNLPSTQPSSVPTSAPTYKPEKWGNIVFQHRRFRTGTLCDNHCSGHGACEFNNICECGKGITGEYDWTGPDCSQRTCPKDFAWVGAVVAANDMHPWIECSNKGICDRATGSCDCFYGYDGLACQRSACPNNCNGRGTCFPQRLFGMYTSHDVTQKAKFLCALHIDLHLSMCCVKISAFKYFV